MPKQQQQCLWVFLGTVFGDIVLYGDRCATAVLSRATDLSVIFSIAPPPFAVMLTFIFCFLFLHTLDKTR